MRVVVFSALVGAFAALALAGCDAGPSAVTKAPPGAPQAAAAGNPASDPRDAPVPLVNGKPMWAANKHHTAAENAQYQFTKNGKDFGAASEDDYVSKVHAFLEAPPAGVQTIKRSNGDSLIYDAKANVFAVMSRTGAPRTMFKPRDGAAYWRQQQDRQAKAAAGGDDSQS